MYHNPWAVVQVNGRRSKAFAIERSVRQSCPLSPLLYILVLEPLLRRLRDEGANPALRGVPFAGLLTARVSASADYITVFVSRRRDIKAVKKAVAGYERISEPRSILTKVKVCGSVLERVAMPCKSPSAGVTDPSSSSGCGLGPTSSWSEIGRRYRLRWMPWLPRRSAFNAKILAYLPRDAVWWRKASRTFPRLKSDPKAEGRRKPRGELPFFHECRTVLRNLSGSSDLSRPRKELYRNLVVGSASDPLSERRDWTAEEVRSHWNWVPDSGFLNNSEFSLTWRFAWNALPLLGLNFSGLEETAEHAFYCDRVRPFWDHVGEWTACIEPKQLVLLNIGYVVDNVLTAFQGEKRVVFLGILAVARMVILTTRKKGLYDDANFFHRDMIMFFRHQLRVKIRCNRKCLDRITFDKRWVNAAS